MKIEGTGVYHVYQFNSDTGNIDPKRYNSLIEAEKDFNNREIDYEKGKLYLDYSDNYTVEQIAVR